MTSAVPKAKAVSAMRRSEVLAELAKLPESVTQGFEAASLTAPELKEILKQARAKEDKPATTQQQVAALSKLKRAELISALQVHSFKFSTAGTKAAILIEFRRHLMDKEAQKSKMEEDDTATAEEKKTRKA